MTISVIIPAYNEEKNIESTVENVIKAIKGKFTDYEILIFNDCSQDNTGNIVEKLARLNGRIKVIHNKKNEGFAYNYKKGVELANNDYIAIIPGDDEILPESISEIFSLVGKAEIIIPYTVNYRVRSLSRRVISFSFTAVMNFLFGLKLKYYNGPVVHKREIIKSVLIKSKSFAFQAEILVKLIKKNRSFIEMGMYIKNRKYGKSKALRLTNILGVFKTIIMLFEEIYLWEGFRIFENKKRFVPFTVLFSIVILFGLSVFFNPSLKFSGWIGYVVISPFLKFFEFLISFINK
ncbi:MAG: glycosyltransferase family 2 protein [Candidatus Nealsonbacteria bacterium]|nr:glycosyltransferase family 2 protein [Candidatus Nealsonbacteria bacterium]